MISELKKLHREYESYLVGTSKKWNDDNIFELKKKIQNIYEQFENEKFLKQKPWKNKRGITLYPVILEGKRLWVTVPED